MLRASGALVLALASTTGGAAALAQAGKAAAAQSGTAAPYRINPGDELEVYVWGEDRLRRVVKVLPDGSFSYPLVGRVEVEQRDRGRRSGAALPGTLTAGRGPPGRSAGGAAARSPVGRPTAADGSGPPVREDRRPAGHVRHSSVVLPPAALILSLADAENAWAVTCSETERSPPPSTFTS